VLERYEEELDRELINRERVQESLMGRMGEMRMGGDMGAMQRMMEEGREASVRVRDVNRRYARQVQEALPENKQFEFARAVKTASFPDIYRETHAERSIAAAAGFADLDATQREGLESIRTNYTREVSVLNDRLAAAQEELEMNFNIQRMMQGGRDLGPVGELRRQKRELDQNTVENLQKLLRPEQVSRLPQREENRDWRGGGGGGRDGGGDRGQRRRGGEQRRGGGQI
jgi:hypothetical protein